MQENRFDSLTRAMATRLSRRGALARGGAAIAGAALVATGIDASRAAAKQADKTPLYTVVRHYPLYQPPTDLVSALNSQFIELACKANGFRAFFVTQLPYVAPPDATPVAGSPIGVLMTVLTFGDKGEYDAFAPTEQQWLEANSGTLIAKPTDEQFGETIVYAADAARFEGTCPAPPATATAIPATTATATATATAAPATATATTAPATATATTVPPCTGEGCDCATGTQNPCDSGLVCCGGPDTPPGGTGTCTTEDQCGGATPISPCDGVGCACTAGVANPCSDGLTCCQGENPVPGGDGICTETDKCGNCTGVGCYCHGGVQNACDNGLICCQPTPEPGGQGACAEVCAS